MAESTRSLKETVFKNVLTGWVEKVIAVLATIVLTPMIISCLGKEQYGIFTAIGHGAGLLLLLDFGIANTISRFVARNTASKRYDENIKVVSSAIAIFFVSSIIICLLTLFVSPFIPDLFSIDIRYERAAKFVFIITGLNIALVLPLRIARGILQASNRYDLISFANIVASFIRVLLLFFLIQTGLGNLINITIAYAFLTTLLELIICVQIKKTGIPFQFTLTGITKSNIIRLFSLGTSALLQTVSATIYKRFQIIAVSIILGMSATPLFSVPSTLISTIAPFVNRLGATFVPLASTMDVRGETNNLQELNIVGVRYGMLISMPLAVLLFFWSEDILQLWLTKSGLSHHDISMMSKVISLVIFPFALSTPHTASRSILMATGKHWIVASGFIMCSLLGLIISITLMHASKLNVLGAAGGLSSTYLFTGCFLYPYLICNHLNISKIVYIKRVYLGPIFSAFLLAFVCFVLNRLWPSHSPVYLLLKMVVCSIHVLLLSYYIVLLPEHRSYLLGNVLLKFLNK